MKTLALVALLTVIGVAGWSVDSLSQYSVCPERFCYLACPSGDASFCFCIKYNDEPLQLHTSQVYMKIECLNGSLHVCTGETLDKAAYLRQDTCIVDPGCGGEYCWYFQIGGCCLEALLSLHLKDDPTPFYQELVVIKTPDVSGDGLVDLVDMTLLLDEMGGSSTCYDLNCDGIVDELDLEIVDLHFNHYCEQMVDTEESSWGLIKSIYRK
ncbi:MAG: hypothetical protein JSU64_03710 [candidate division WOR-3 bacterium]|nr:MAG: hypothetical protein JSU64_03710 [candidate division WOR-3 bacterium]UCF06935.1 MAG: hypothetical protein JSV33_07920 [bacterium]